MTGSMKGDVTGRGYVRPKRHASPLMALFVVIVLAALGYWYLEWDRCRDRGPDWLLLRNALGFPVCVKAERAP